MKYIPRLLVVLVFLSEARAQDVKRDIPYADPAHERQVLDVYSPQNAKNLPVAFWIHGGGWQTGDKSSVQIKPQFFMNKGFVFVSTNYRLLPSVDMATIVRDIAKSVRWVHDHIAEHGGDPNRLFIMGHSAGAQLAALICTDDRYLKAEDLSLAMVKGCVPVDGDTFDVSAIVETEETRRRVHGLPQAKFSYRQKFGNDSAKHHDFSAITHVTKDKGIPPFLILYVAEHPYTGAQAQRFGKVLKDAGVPVTLFGAKDTTHNKINADLGLPDDPATKALFEFLGNKPVKSSGQDKGVPNDKPKRAEEKGISGKRENALERQKRNLRWVMRFNTKNIDEYLNQLQALGATLAVPQDKDNMQFRVFRQLKQRPLKGEIEDAAKLQRIFWIEDKEKSVKELVEAMQLKEVPKFVVAFFPEKLEKELLEKELKYQNRKEDEILETQFRVVLREGTYEIEVVKQTPRMPAAIPQKPSFLHVLLRQRLPAANDPVRFEVVQRNEQWDPKKTALIVCDMWDLHHCKRAVDRVKEMAPCMNEVIAKARDQGVFIIHAPSECMAAYENTPMRQRAKNAPPAKNLPKDIASGCDRIPAEEKGRYPIDQSDGGEDDEPAEHSQWAAYLTSVGRNPKAPWKKEIDVLEIKAQDAVSDSGVEIWNLLEERGIHNVMLMGVHTNMCVLGRPFGLRQMAKNGKHVVLMRDLTDTMYNPARWPYISHFEGTERIIEHIEKFVCPTTTSDQILGGKPFRFEKAEVHRP